MSPAPSRGDPPFAEIVVAAPLRRTHPGPAYDVPPRKATFHYHVPADLDAACQIGHLVRVGFGRQQVLGVVLDRAEVAPVDETKPVLDVIGDEPVLAADLVELARWESDAVLAPLWECVNAMLPPGALSHEVPVWHRTQAPIDPQELTADELELVGAFAGGKRMTEPEARRAAGQKRVKARLNRLVKRGLLIADTDRVGRRIGPTTRHVARLAVSPNALGDHLAAIDGELRARGKLTPRVAAAALEALDQAEQGLDVPTLRSVLGISLPQLRRLEKLGAVELTEEPWVRDPMADRAVDRRPPPVLTPEQSRAWETMSEWLAGALAAEPTEPTDKPDPDRVMLLHGVTGSGKTELYLRALAQVLEAGRSAIVLVPEIALTPQTVQRVAGRFGARVGLWHSQLSDGERHDTWQRAREGELDVIVGSRSAVFAPVPRLGLIVVDEEHTDTYKQTNVPRYDARRVAVARANLAGAGVIFGSATPSVEAFWHAERGASARVTLTRRVAAIWSEKGGPAAGYHDLPEVEIVDMRRELMDGNRTIFSRALWSGLAEVLTAGDQAVLFLNRRGSATFVMCRDCGHVVACPRCDAPLTFHRAGADLACHRCGHKATPPMMCPECGSHRIRYFGLGTQAVEDAVADAYPAARLVRWDADTTRRKGQHEALLQRFADGDADILIGTQMVAKGLDLPAVTLVGVVSADTSLNLPDYRSAERTFQNLTQVAGRAGRSAKGGRVIVQTYKPEEPAIVAAARHDYDRFFRREAAFRGEHMYPPYSRFVRLEYQHKTAKSAETSARDMARQLREHIAKLGAPETEVIGPAPCYFTKVRDRWRWHLIVRTPDPHALLGNWAFGPGWRVDVDPVSTL